LERIQNKLLISAKILAQQEKGTSTEGSTNEKNIRCDFLVLNITDNCAFLIENKKSRNKNQIEHAIRQVFNTAIYMKTHLKNYKLHGRIVSSNNTIGLIPDEFRDAYDTEFNKNKNLFNTFCFTAIAEDVEKVCNKK